MKNDLQAGMTAGIKTKYKEMTLHRLFPARYRRLHRKYVREREKARETRQEEVPSGQAHKRPDTAESAPSVNVVFLEEYGESLSDNCKTMRRELKRRGGYRMCAVYLHREKGRALSLALSSHRIIEVLARADLIFLDDSSELLSCLPLGPDVTVIQLWHACGAFKKFGYSLADKEFGAGRAELDRFPRHRNFTYVTVSSPEVQWAYAQAFHMEERADAIRPVGIARTDRFFDAGNLRTAWEHLRRCLPSAELAPFRDVFGSHASASFLSWQQRLRLPGKRIVLYAPTFRGNASDARVPKEPDFDCLRRILGEDWVFLVKHHPYVKDRPKIPAALRGYVCDMTDRMAVEELMMVSHACITDYSSLIFEYALLERPLLFYVPDLEDYQDWRGFYYPFEEMTPGPVLKATEDLAAHLARMDTWFDREGMAAFRNKYMSACDGNAAKRIADLAEAGR